MRQSMSVCVSLYIVERRCRMPLLLSSAPTFISRLPRAKLPLHACSLHANISTRRSTWLSYEPSRLRSRLRCLPHRHRLRHQHHLKSPPLKGSVGARTTVYSVLHHRHAWTHSSMKMSTKHLRKRRRRTGGSAASVKSSLTEAPNVLDPTVDHFHTSGLFCCRICC